MLPYVPIGSISDDDGDTGSQATNEADAVSVVAVTHSVTVVWDVGFVSVVDVARRCIPYIFMSPDAAVKHSHCDVARCCLRSLSPSPCVVSSVYQLQDPRIS